MEKLPVRRSNRLPEYDYSQNGAYFVTFCVKEHKWIFWETKVGAIINRPPGTVPLNEAGRIVEQAIQNIGVCYPGVIVEKYVIMPNHVHLLLLLQQYDVRGMPTNGRLIIAPTDISKIVQQLKSYVTKRLGRSVWQKSFHDHVIRNETSYRQIWTYIDENPLKSDQDCYFISE